MLAFVIIWAYLAYSQFMLIWAANITEEVPWYLARLNDGWQFVAIALLVLHFAIPLSILMFRDVKRNRWLLAATAAFLFLMRIVDTFWLVVPSFANRGEASSLGRTLLPWWASGGCGWPSLPITWPRRR
jgi:hypothetical protein